MTVAIIEAPKDMMFPFEDGAGDLDGTVAVGGFPVWGFPVVGDVSGPFANVVPHSRLINSL
jgi:hypothetical protein